MPTRPEPVTPASQAAVLDDWATLMDHLLDAKFEWVASMQWQPRAGSPFDELARLLLRQYGPGGDWDASDAQNALGIASMFLELMGQYLEGMVALVRSRHVIVPLAPLARSLFEAACQVAWILEPPPPRPGRAAYQDVRRVSARVTAVRLHDLTRAKTVAHSLDQPNANLWGKAVHDLRKVHMPARFFPSELTLNKKGVLVACGEELLGFGQMAAVFERVHGLSWKAAGLYDYLSNASHPTPSTIFENTTEGVLGTRRFEIADASYPSRLCRMASIALLHSWDLTAKFLGHGAVAIEELRDHISRIPEC